MGGAGDRSGRFRHQPPNLDGLLEIVDLQAQVLELQADYAGFAEGTVLEAQVEEGRGPVARLIVQQGQINKGDFIVVGRACGRVRDIVNDRGERVNQAGPGDPIAISGIDELPDSGDNFYCVKNLKQAEAAAEERRQAERERNLAGEKVTLDNIFNVLAEQKKAELPIIVKGDVFGSIETLKGQLGKIGSEEVKVTIKHSAVGGINDSDVTLAEATGAIIIGTTSPPLAKLSRPRPRALIFGTTTSFMSSSMMSNVPPRACLILN